MPTGKPLAYMVDNEVVEVLYTCVKCAQNNIDFDEVARLLGLENATVAKNRLARVLKAQQKGGGAVGQSDSAVTSRVGKTVGAKRGGKPRQPETANDGNLGSDIDDNKFNSKEPKLTNGQMKGEGGEVTREVTAEREG